MMAVFDDTEIDKNEAACKALPPPARLTPSLSFIFSSSHNIGGRVSCDWVCCEVTWHLQKKVIDYLQSLSAVHMPNHVCCHVSYIISYITSYTHIHTYTHTLILTLIHN